MSDKTDQERSIDSAISQIERRFGKGSIMRLGEAEPPKVDVISSGSMAIDIISGIGGLPRGRIIEIYGPEGSGKTTVALHAIAEAQKAGGVAAFIDAEHALDVYYAERIGVNLKNLLISQPTTGEEALEIADTLVRSNAIAIVVIDSVAALIPKSELEGEMGDVTIALQARLMSQALRKLTGTVNKSKTACVFINQLREKVSTGYTSGPIEVTPGGRALKFYASMRIEVRRGEAIKSSVGEIIGAKMKIKIVKNKLAPPFKETELILIYGQGIDKTTDLFETALNLGFITRSGSFYYFKDLRLGQGKDASRALLDENADLRNELMLAVRTYFEPDTKAATDEKN
ncbi:Protein recA [Thermodesulfobium narugense DSM 14796]|uniref:Protein RecA n=1 Tax=Thermodesulfobium narugense DSM 14796 TaxID=747365 RepID=M1E4W4_9BACT|nr:recombinase RecA [Thermodesulfobium narugense]AEE13801.1 Protein recA [Thermodesulfobium narugense DSM 14796]